MDQLADQFNADSMWIVPLDRTTPGDATRNAAFIDNLFTECHEWRTAFGLPDQWDINFRYFWGRFDDIYGGQRNDYEIERLTANRIQVVTISVSAIQMEQSPKVRISPRESLEPGVPYINTSIQAPPSPMLDMLFKTLPAETLMPHADATGKQVPPRPLTAQEQRMVEEAIQFGDQYEAQTGMPTPVPPELLVSITDRVAAEATQTVFDAMWQENGCDRRVIENVLNNAIFGHQFLVLQFDAERCRFILRNPEPHRVFMDPTATCVEDAHYAGFDDVLSEDEAVSRYPKIASKVRAFSNSNAITPAGFEYRQPYLYSTIAFRRKMLVVRKAWLRHQPFAYTPEQAIARGLVRQEITQELEPQCFCGMGKDAPSTEHAMDCPCAALDVSAAQIIAPEDLDYVDPQASDLEAQLVPGDEQPGGGDIRGGTLDEAPQPEGAAHEQQEMPVQEGAAQAGEANESAEAQGDTPGAGEDDAAAPAAGDGAPDHAEDMGGGGGEGDREQGAMAGEAHDGAFAGQDAGGTDLVPLEDAALGVVEPPTHLIIDRPYYVLAETGEKTEPGAPNWPCRYGIRELVIINREVVADGECKDADIPLCLNRNIPLPYGYAGQGEPERLEGLQRAVNNLLTDVVNHVKTHSEPPEFMPTSVVQELDDALRDTYVGQSGRRIEVPDDIWAACGGRPQFVGEVPQMPPDTWRLLEMAIRLIDDVSGHSEVLQGKASPSWSGEAIQALQGAAKGVIGFKSKNTETMLERLAMLMVHRISQMPLAEWQKRCSKFPPHVLYALHAHAKTMNCDFSAEISSGGGYRKQVEQMNNAQLFDRGALSKTTLLEDANKNPKIERQNKLREAREDAMAQAQGGMPGGGMAAPASPQQQQAQAMA
jgi:hypothetical protein